MWRVVFLRLKKSSHDSIHAVCAYQPFSYFLTKPRNAQLRRTTGEAQSQPGFMMQLNLQQPKLNKKYTKSLSDTVNTSTQNDSCGKFKRTLRSICSHTHMPLKGTINATLTNGLQSTVVLWHLAHHLQCGQTAITTFFSKEGRNTPTCIFCHSSEVF